MAPYYEDNPLAAALGAAGSFLSGSSAAKQQAIQNRQYDEQIRQAAADAAARIKVEEDTQRFNESLYAPGQYKPKVTKGTYTQSHPGHPKGSEKIMTGQPEYVPGTGGYYTQQLEA